jgi:molybdate transport system substrate-binding protein
MTFRASLIAAALFGALTLPAVAQKPAVHVLASNGMKAVVEELQPRIEHAIGHPLAIEYGSTTGLMERLDKGEGFDVAILTAEGVDQLVGKGRVAAATRADFARCGIGLAVKAGAAKPDISTAAAMKRTLEAAPSITYAGDGASRPAIDRMLEKLGLAEKAKSKIILTKGSGAAMASVAEGRVAIVMTLMSELLPVKGIDVVGPFPAELQNYVRFGAGIGVQATQPEGAKALVVFLRSADAAPIYSAKGMELIRK